MPMYDISDAPELKISIFVSEHSLLLYYKLLPLYHTSYQSFQASSFLCNIFTYLQTYQHLQS